MKHFLTSVAVTAALSVAHAEPPVIVPLELHNHSSIIVATIEGQDVPLVFDLGDQTAVKLDQSVLDRIKAVPTGKSTKEIGLKGHVIEIPTYTVPLMRIGTAEFRNVIAQLSKYEPTYTPRKIGDQGAQPDKGRTHHPTADDWNKEFRAYEVRNLGDGPAARIRRIHGLQLLRPPRCVHQLSRQAGADPLIYCAFRSQVHTKT